MLPFRLPPTNGSLEEPLWNGSVFVVGTSSLPVAEYSENGEGWSDELTAMHENVSGGRHPIDIASRHDAISQVRLYIRHPQSVILEIGCSSGFLIKDLVESFPKAVVVGADVVKEPLYRLSRELPGVPLFRFDLLRCPLPDQSVDILIMLNVLEHIDDDVGALKKALNMLKPGGYLVIEVPAGSFLYDDYDRELCHFRRYDSTEIKRKLNEVGFEVVRHSHLGLVLYPAFVCIKLFSKVVGSIMGKRNVVNDQARMTARSSLVRVIMEFESNYLAHFKLPFGIRSVSVARRRED